MSILTNSLSSGLVACPDCDAIQVLRDPAPRLDVVCFRCGALLAHGGGDKLDRSLALTAAAVPLFLAANWFPLMRLDGPDGRIEATVLGAVRALYQQQRGELALLVLLLATVLPALWLGSVAYLLVALRRRRRGSLLAPVFRLVQALGPWTQVEILLLGMLVAFGKLAGLFHMVPGVALPCIVAFLLLARLVSRSLDPRVYWRRMGGLR